MFTSRCIALVALLSLAAHGFPAQEKKPPSISELRKRARRAVLSVTKTRARGQYGDVLTLVKRLREKRRTREALRFLKNAVKVAPWELEAGLALAEILVADGKVRTAEQLAGTLLDRAEANQVRLGALRILGREPDLEFPALSRAEGSEARIILLPVEPGDPLVVREICRHLRTLLPVSTVIRKLDMEIPPPTRMNSREFYEDSRRVLQNLLDRGDVHALKALKVLKKQPADLIDLETVGAVRCKICELQERWVELGEVQTTLVAAREPQWQADKVMDTVNAAIRPFRRECTVYLAVTRADLYAKDHAFDFSLSGTEGCVLMSYNRFRTIRNQEEPNWKLLLERTVKQAICSVGRSIGMGRCDDRRCVFAHAGVIEGHDAKEAEPCEMCRKEFLSRLNR